MDNPWEKEIQKHSKYYTNSNPLTDEMRARGNEPPMVSKHNRLNLEYWLHQKIHSTNLIPETLKDPRKDRIYSVMVRLIILKLSHYAQHVKQNTTQIPFT